MNRPATLASTEHAIRFGLIAERMRNGVAVCRIEREAGVPVDWTYLYTNPAFHAQTGIGEIVGRRASEALPGLLESDPRLLEIYSRVADTQQSESFEIYLPTLEAWFAVQAYSTEPGHFVAIFDVVTAQRLRDQEIREFRERLSLAQRASRSGIWDWNIKTGQLTWSDEMTRLMGLEPGLAPTFEDWRRVVHVDDLIEAEQRIQRAVTDRTAR
jgi:PAS domain-containing protein